MLIKKIDQTTEKPDTGRKVTFTPRKIQKVDARELTADSIKRFPRINAALAK